MNLMNERNPEVINHLMIARCLEEQGIKGEIEKLTREDGIDWNEVTHIRLEFMNVLKIDHLWVLPSLTMLSLNNNSIEYIENLQVLVNLKELDLSFNKIRKIENLNHLVKLETINLFSNFIEKIENMDNLFRLLIFSIGNNKINNGDNILYLRQFKRLKSLNLSGNPCIYNAATFRTFVITFLPQLIYYEYKMIAEDERKEGKIIHIKKLQNLENEEMSLIESKLAADRAEAIIHADSFVEFLGSKHLFEEMFHKDKYGKALLKLGDETKESYKEYEIIFSNLCRQTFEQGVHMYQIRKLEVEQYFTITETAKIKNQDKSIQYIEDFLKLKNDIFKQVKTDKDAFEKEMINKKQYTVKCLENKKKYYEKIHKSWQILMRIEITLFEQIEETNELFKKVLNEMVNNFIDMSQQYFSKMRIAQETYNERITEIALRYLTLYNVTTESIIAWDVIPIFSDRRTLIDALVTSHNLHLNTINGREDRLINRAKTWLSNIVINLQRKEINRNRSKILEINHYLDIQKEEFEDIIIIPVL